MEMAFPFRRRARGGQVADVGAQAAGLDTGGGRDQDAGVVDAGPHVEDRRDAHGLADLGQTGSAELGGFRAQQAVLARGHGFSSGYNTQEDSHLSYQSRFLVGER